VEGEVGIALATLSAVILGWALLSRRAEGWGLTGPMVFIVAGVLLGDVVDPALGPSTVRLLAEITLAIVLFHDASTVRLAALRRDPWIAVRLLGVGFPLALALTTATTAWLLPAAGVAGAVLIAGSVTPTDAGLGAPTILNPTVPVRVRRAMNVESGLNDGLATPIVLAALAALVQTSGGEEDTALSLAVQPLLVAVAVGVVVGLLGAYLLDQSRAHDWSSPRGRALAVLLLPLLVYGAAEVLEGTVFIAAFVGGLVLGRASRCIEEEQDASETLEIAADLLSGVLWFLAGGLFLVALSSGFRWQWLALGVLALTVLRIVPVALALLGTGFKAPTVLFLGWFGPRGVATIVFGLLAVESLDQGPLLTDVVGVVSVTVLLSVVAHGVSAGPLAQRYGEWAKRTQGPIEMEPTVEPMPSRGRSSHD
jgi:NhaP-type Na+/H+ or K+/H+ antiporter